jgi:hypothetical protein
MSSMRNGFGQILIRKFTAILMYLQPMSLQHAPFPAAMKCMMIARVAGAVKGRKSDTNMSQNQY